jgi:hypothetical protein
MEILAAVNWEDIVLVGSAMGVFTGGKAITTKLLKSNGGSGKYIKELCDEKHKLIDKRDGEVTKNFDKVFEKLDKIMEHLVSYANGKQ